MRAILLEAVVRVAQIVKVPTRIKFAIGSNPNHICTYFLDNGILGIYPEMAYSDYYTNHVKSASAVFFISPFDSLSKEEIDHIVNQVSASMYNIGERPSANGGKP